MTNTRTRMSFNAEGIGFPALGPIAGLAVGEFWLGIDTGDDTLIYKYFGRATTQVARFASSGPFEVKPIPFQLLFPDTIKIRIDVHGSQAFSDEHAMEIKIYDPTTKSVGWAEERQVKMVGGIIAGMSLNGDFESIHPPSKRYQFWCTILKLPVRNIQMKLGPVRRR